MSIFGGVTNSLFPGLGSLGGGNLFGTKQGTVPYTNTTSFSPFAQSYLPNAFNQAQSIYNLNQGPNSLFGQAQNLTGRTLAGDYLNPETNPFLKSSVQNALGLAGSAFAGQYGGPAGLNLGNTGYQEELARTLGQVATNAYSNAYGQERQNQLGAIPFAQSLPYANISGYEGALSPGLMFGTNTTNAQQPYYQNQTASTLGALAGGAGLLKMFG